MARLKEHYEKVVRPSLIQEFSYKNLMMAPRLTKIVLNMGIGEGARDKKKNDSGVTELTFIAGQKAVPTKARVSIAGFKLRNGMNIGTKVTLRQNRMYEFIDRLVNVAMPRIRDFRGLNSKGFDGHGNFSMGIQEHIIFPEIEYDKVDQIRGLDITFVTTAHTNEEGLALLKAFNMPFVK